MKLSTLHGNKYIYRVKEKQNKEYKIKCLNKSKIKTKNFMVEIVKRKFPI